MYNKKKIITILLSIILGGCGVSQEEYNKLKNENVKLKQEIDELKNGEARLAAVIDKSYYQEKNYVVAKQNIVLLKEKHPESKLNEKYNLLLENIENEEKLLKEKELALQKEKIRLENMNNTGMWKVNYYVDEFGNKTKEGFIANAENINGTFSNSATQESPLIIDFMLNPPNKMAIQLFEYAGVNPVKSYSEDNYKVLIQDVNGKKYSLSAVNYSDRLMFENDAKTLHEILLLGGNIKFKIYEVEHSINEYNFEIKDANWYSNAYEKYKMTKK